VAVVGNAAYGTNPANSIRDSFVARNNGGESRLRGISDSNLVERGGIIWHHA